MKFFNKILFIALLLGLASACENTELDLLDNPNQLPPDRASLNDLYNNIQLEFRNVYSSAQGEPGQAARMYHNGGYTYVASTTDATFNGLWNNAYADLFPDIDALISIANERGFDIHGGTARIMKAYSLMVLVDLLGEVPYSEAGQGTNAISPVADPGDQVYNAAIGLLDEAINLLDGTSAAKPAFDNFYGGNTSKWIAFANTLKLRAALNRRLIDPSGSASTINSVLSAGNFIDNASEDFQFNYGSQRTNPDSRHPFYSNHYEVGDGDYMSNYFMWLLRADKTDDNDQPFVDPRIRYYFYRKVDDAVGQDQTTYSCHFSALPDQNAQPEHWKSIDPRLPYCVASADGYSGRDHLNGEGIPPDGPIRTSYGLYPGGGQFDDDTFQDTRQNGTTGGGGQGIWPIMLSSFVDFMRAEAALTIGTSDDPRALLESGIRKSMDKVKSFETLVPGTISRTITFRDGSTANVGAFYGITSDKVDDYVNYVLGKYDAADADGKLDIVIKEYYIAAWGNGLEAYNMYRRTGKPSNMQPSLEPEAGPFPRSFLLPSDHVTRNANVSQRSLSDMVFWDNGSTNLY